MENMTIIKAIVIFYGIGVILSFLILKFVDFLHKNDTGIKPFTPLSQIIGIAGSWIVVVYFIRSMIKGMKAEAVKNKNLLMEDYDLIKATIDNYWVNAITDPKFDKTGITPLLNSPLCDKYYVYSAFLPEDRCRKCPIFKEGHGCLRPNGFFSMYVQYITEHNEPQRKNMAIKIAQIFESVYYKEQF